MRELKLLIVLFIIAVMYSCTNENTDIEKSENFNIEKSYQKVIKSDDPKSEYENYTDNEKAKLWEYKYELFIQESELNDIQLTIINSLKEIAINTIIGENVTEDTYTQIQSDLMNNFDNTQYFDLLYFLDNPSLNANTDSDLLSRNCFWCTMFETTGPCYYDSHGDPVQNATFYNCRFWRCHETASTGTVPCQDNSSALQGNN